MQNTTPRPVSLPRCLHCDCLIRSEAYNVWRVVQPVGVRVSLGIAPYTQAGPYHKECAERVSDNQNRQA